MNIPCTARKKLASSLALLFMLLVAFLSLAQPVKADNQDVLDKAGVIDLETQAKIKEINDTKLHKIKGHPQIAVVTNKSLDDTDSMDIDDYGQKLFDKYHFGTKGYDNGILVIILVKDHKIRIQTGYGAESAVPDLFCNKVIADKEVQSDFKNSNYSGGIEKMVDLLADRVISHQDELRSKSTVNSHYQEKEKDHQDAYQRFVAFLCYTAIGLAIFFLIFAFWISKRNDLTKEDRKEFDKKLKELEARDGLSPDQKDSLKYLSAYDKKTILRRVAEGAIFAVVLREILEQARLQHYHEVYDPYHKHYDDYHFNDDDDDDDDHWFSGGSSFGGGFGGDSGGGSFGGFGGDSGGGGADGGW